MDAWVYHSQRRTNEAAGFIERLRASGEYGLVRPANARYYEGEVHSGDAVFHDGSNRVLVWKHEEAGVDIRLWTEPTLNQGARAQPITVQEKPAEPPGEPAASTEEVRQNGQWFSAYRDGVKVGKSKRSEAEAWAELRGESA